MYSPIRHENALDEIRSYDAGYVSGNLIECALDFLILIEPEPHESYASRVKTNLIRFRNEHKKVWAILRFGGEQTADLDELQVLFDSLTNSTKYQHSINTISVARMSLNTAWNGIHGWLK